MSDSIGNTPTRMDLFMARDDVQRFKEVAKSILSSTAAVSMVALLVFPMVAVVAIAITATTLACLATAGTIVIPLGLEIAIVVLGITMGGCTSVSCAYISDYVRDASKQCKETHQLIWG